MLTGLRQKRQQTPGATTRFQAVIPLTLGTTLVTKAGVPNNKIFVGEASYGRSFHMAVDGCWEPMCEFTGSRTQSDAKPGRCTGESGYLAHAEINEITRSGKGQLFHDHDSNTDVLLYDGLCSPRFPCPFTILSLSQRVFLQCLDSKPNYTSAILSCP
jgi:GH18 family chitinase